METNAFYKTSANKVTIYLQEKKISQLIIERTSIFFYINIYTLNKNIYSHQTYIYMLRYTWEQKNIHIKYKKIQPENNRKKD